MSGLLILVLVALTSAGSYLVGKKVLGLSGRQLGHAAGKMLEGLGLSLVFFALNLVLGVTIILAVRNFTGVFVSVYHVADLSLLLLSCLQGCIFHWWRGLG